MTGLVETVRAARPDLVVPDAFASAFYARLASAAAAWRDVNVVPDRFLEFLAPRLEPPVAVLDQLHVEDLYLACAILDGSSAGIAAFDRVHGAGMDLAIKAAGIEPPDLPELRRRTRERLIVKIGDAPPKLATYSGRGSLGSWVRIFAMREAQRVMAAG